MKYSKLKGKFEYQGPAQSAYNVTVRKPFNWLWLLLLLLLVPLFIRCERELTVEVVNEAGDPVENVLVTMDARAHYLYKEGFFTSFDVAKQAKTDRHGIARLSKPCSVWGYIFHPSQQMTVTADPPLPYESNSESANYHYTSRLKIVLHARPADIPVRVVDAMDGHPLPGAEVVATVNGSATGVYTTDSQGIAIIPGIHPDDVVSLAGRKEGYATNDKTIVRVKGSDLNSDPMKEIPLDKIYECDDNVQYSSESKPLIVIPNIDMHQPSGTFVLDVVTYSQPDRFVVKDANGKQLLDTGCISTGAARQSFTVNFSTQHITIEAYADPDGNPTTSVWEIYPHCPK